MQLCANAKTASGCHALRLPAATGPVRAVTATQLLNDAAVTLIVRSDKRTSLCYANPTFAALTCKQMTGAPLLPNAQIGYSALGNVTTFTFSAKPGSKGAPTPAQARAFMTSLASARKALQLHATRRVGLANMVMVGGSGGGQSCSFDSEAGMVCTQNEGGSDPTGGVGGGYPEPTNTGNNEGDPLPSGGAAPGWDDPGYPGGTGNIPSPDPWDNPDDGSTGSEGAPPLPGGTGAGNAYDEAPMSCVASPFGSVCTITGTRAPPVVGGIPPAPTSPYVDPDTGQSLFPPGTQSPNNAADLCSAYQILCGWPSFNEDNSHPSGMTASLARRLYQCALRGIMNLGTCQALKPFRNAEQNAQCMNDAMAIDQACVDAAYRGE